MPGATGPTDAATQTFYYFGFGAGEYGAQAGHLVGYRLLRQTLYYAGAFTAENVIRYIDGSLGPRPEATDITPTGLPAARCFGLGMGTADGVAIPSSPVTQYLWALYSNGLPASTVGGGVYRIPLQAGGTAVKFAGPSIPVPQSGAGTTTIVNRDFGTPTVVAEQTTAIPDFGGMIQSVAIGNTVYCTSQGNGFYTILFDPQYTGAAGVVGFVGNGATSSGPYPDGYPLCLYGTFLVGTSFSQPNRLLFSADAGTDPQRNLLDFSQSPGHGAFLDVGDATPIVGLFPTRHGLYIAKSTSWPALGGNVSPTFSVDEWWLMTGTPGTGAIVRKILDGPVATQDTGTVLGDGTVGFLAPGATDGPSPVQMTPSIFTGSAVQSYRYLEGAGQFGPADYAGFDGWFPKVLRLREPHDWMVVPQTQTGDGPPSGFIRRDGIWTQHALGSVVGGGSLHATNVTAFADPQNDRVFIATAIDASGPGSPFRGGGSVFQTPAEQHIQMWSAYVEAPSSAPYIQADPGQVSFTLPEWTSRIGGDVAVREVSVDFKVWPTLTPPTIVCTLLALRLYEGSDAVPHVGNPAFEGLVVGLPQRRRHSFTFPTEFGNGFQLAFSNLNGVSVEKVEVSMLTRPAQY